MRFLFALVVVVVLAIAAFAFGLIDINQTKDAKLPQVAVQGGQAPSFDVDTAKVKVGSTETDVEVPTIDVGTRKETVELPKVDVQKAQ